MSNQSEKELVGAKSPFGGSKRLELGSRYAICSKLLNNILREQQVKERYFRFLVEKIVIKLNQIESMKSNYKRLVL